MRLDRNIILSLAMHASILLAAVIYAVGINVSPASHEKYFTVTLLETQPDSVTAAPPSGRRETKAEARVPSPVRHLKRPPLPLLRLPAAPEAVTSTVSGSGERAATPIKSPAELSGTEEIRAASHTHGEDLPAGAISVSLMGTGHEGSTAQGESGTGGGDAASLGIIRGAIQRALIYPSAARRRGFEGTVVAEFRIGGKGLPEGVTITKSSGHGVLDEAASETIRRAAPFPPVQGTIEIPITFRLTRARE